MTIVGISGSPIIGGNTDRIVEAVLERSGKEHLFINLSKLRYDPCRACSHRCAPDNLCKADDDLKPVIAEIKDAEALVFGTPVHAGAVTGWMSSFISRLSCFTHVVHPMQDKPLVLVLTAGFRGSERLFPRWKHDVEAQACGIKFVGDIFYESVIVPCFKCGRGSECHVGGLWGLVGRDEERLRNFQFTKDIFNRWEDSPETVAKVDEHAKFLAEL